MNLVKENIEFKRGQDSKKALDVGMTLDHYFNDTLQRLKSMRISNRPDKSSGSFYIRLGGTGHEDFVLQYNHNTGKWILRRNDWQFYESTDYEDFWKNGIDKLEKYHKDKAREYRDLMREHEYHLEDIKEWRKKHER